VVGRRKRKATTRAEWKVSKMDLTLDGIKEGERAVSGGTIGLVRSLRGEDVSPEQRSKKGNIQGNHRA